MSCEPTATRVGGLGQQKRPTTDIGWGMRRLRDDAVFGLIGSPLQRKLYQSTAGPDKVTTKLGLTRQEGSLEGEKQHRSARMHASLLLNT